MTRNAPGPARWGAQAPASPAPAALQGEVDAPVIRVSRLDGKEFVINVLLVETVEAVPDTVITLTNGHKYVVRESVDEVVERAVAFHRRIGRWPQ